LRYEDNVHSIKEVINDLASGKTLNYEKITEMSDALIGELHNRNGIIQCLSTIRDFDVYTYCHSINVALYSMLVARWVRLSIEEIREAVLAGLLHDIGKSHTPTVILNKKGKLNDDEFDIMKKHPIYGYNLAKEAPQISKEVLKAILMHHEREDGTGYPLGINGDQQGLYTKIVAIADVYDALTSERVYKQRITPFETFKIIERTGLGHFDTRILMTFLHNIASYYIGAGVVMSNGKKGTVAFVSSNCISSPIVLVEDKCIDLSRETELKILCMES
jgi:putative nucleotidyltransferase with HDIG domain